MNINPKFYPTASNMKKLWGAIGYLQKNGGDSGGTPSTPTSIDASAITSGTVDDSRISSNIARTSALTSKVDKETGKSLIANSEISRLAGGQVVRTFTQTQWNALSTADKQAIPVAIVDPLT